MTEMTGRDLPLAPVQSVLVIDDEPRIVSFLSRALAMQGFAVDGAHGGADGLRMLGERSYDLVLLDLMMPGVDGVEVLRTIVEDRPDQKVLVLSARGDVPAKVGCLDLGAADYMTKPFALPELVARIKLRLRAESSGSVTRRGRLVLDVERRMVNVGQGPVRLSDREFRVLNELARRPGEVCSREDLLEWVWGLAFDPGTNVVDVCIGRLRKKLGDTVIETVRNAGYRLSPSGGSGR